MTRTSPDLTSATLELDVTSLAFEGKGIARHDNRVVFIPRTAPGDRVQATVLRDKKSFLEAELDRVLTPGPVRREPPCPVWEACGGCHLMHVDEAAQLEAKRGFVRDALARIAKTPLEPDPVLAAPATTGYRRRASMKGRTHDGALTFGFLRASTHQVVDVPRCLVLAPAITRVHAQLRQLLVEEAPRLATSEFRVDLASDADDRASVLAFVARRDQVPWARIAAALATDGAVVEVRDEKGQRMIEPPPGERLAYRLAIGGRTLEYRFTPGAFTQINFEQNQKLVETVLALAGGPHARVLDLYSGIGNYALPLALTSGYVLGIESAPPAVADARENAARMKLTNVRFECATAKAGLRDLIARGERFDLVLLNPTRAGAEGIGQELVDLRAPKIVYVSCNPPTLARDIARLVSPERDATIPRSDAGGYRLERVIPLDLFPQTYHVESVALLSASAKGEVSR